MRKWILAITLLLGIVVPVQAQQSGVKWHAVLSPFYQIIEIEIYEPAYTAKVDFPEGVTAFAVEAESTSALSNWTFEVEDPSSKQKSIYHFDRDPHAVREGLSHLVLLVPHTSSIELINWHEHRRLKLHLLFAGEVKPAPLPALMQKRDGECEEPASIPPSIWRAGLPAPDVAPDATDPDHIIVHHTATTNLDTNGLNSMRNIYLYHTEVNGWDDIGYNYLIARDGTIYAGRDGQGLPQDKTKGAHFCGKNTGTMGVALIGSYNEGYPADTTIASLIQLMAWKLNKENLDPLSASPHPAISDPLLGSIAGHRDGCPTECPGDSTYAMLPEIRLMTAAAMSGCPPFTSIDSKEDAGNWVNVYPQPAQDRLYLTATRPAQYVLLDIQGKVLVNGLMLPGQSEAISIQDFPAGMYVLRVQSGDEVQQLKVVVR